MSDDSYNGQIDALTLAIEQAVHTIERELHHHLDPVERIAIERVLERLADDVPAKRMEPW